VADDRVALWAEDQAAMATAPARLAGLIEARGVGLLRARPVGPVPVGLAVDLDRVETARLPQRRTISLAGAEIDLLRKVPSPHFPAAILQFLSAGRAEP